MSTDRIAELRGIAEAATAGPWTREFVFNADERERSDLEHYWNDSSEWAYNAEPFRVEGPTHAENGEFAELTEADAEHIATFDPPTVLKLLEAVELLEQLTGSAELGILGYDVGPLNAGIWKDARAALAALEGDG